jgi:hypothetical protein
MGLLLPPPSNSLGPGREHEDRRAGALRVYGIRQKSPSATVAEYDDMATEVLRERYNGKDSWQQIFSGSVRAALAGILGESGAASLCYHMELGDMEIDPRAVQQNLRLIMSEGAVVLQRAILLEFYRQLNLPREFESILPAVPGRGDSPGLDFESLVMAGAKAWKGERGEFRRRPEGLEGLSRRD